MPEASPPMKGSRCLHLFCFFLYRYIIFLMCYCQVIVTVLTKMNKTFFVLFFKLHTHPSGTTCEYFGQLYYLPLTWKRSHFGEFGDAFWQMEWKRLTVAAAFGTEWQIRSSNVQTWLQICGATPSSHSVREQQHFLSVPSSPLRTLVPVLPSALSQFVSSSCFLAQIRLPAVILLKPKIFDSRLQAL